MCLIAGKLVQLIPHLHRVPSQKLLRPHQTLPGRLNFEQTQKAFTSGDDQLSRCRSDASRRTVVEGGFVAGDSVYDQP